MSITMYCNNLLKLLLIFQLISIILATNTSTILWEISPFIRVYTNGTIERLSGTYVVPASYDPKTQVLSKDVEISPNLNISARLYLPKNASTNLTTLPLLVYFHGGAFFTGSAFSPTYHNFMNSLASEANVVAVSVNYRLAPEHPLPIGYQDSWLALKWVVSHSNVNNIINGSDPWLIKYVDFGNVYLGGDSSGGNIAHNMAIRAGLDKMDGIVFDGMFLDSPYFWGSKPIGNETNDPEGSALAESVWIHAYPNSTGFDDPLLNPGLDPNLSKLGCKKVLVYVGENDIVRDRGWYYGEALTESKWDGVVKVVEIKGEGHVFNLRFPDDENAKIVMKQLASLLNGGEVL